MIFKLVSDFTAAMNATKAGGDESALGQALGSISGYNLTIVGDRPVSPSGLSNLSALIYIRPTRIDFRDGLELHLGSVDIFSPSMATAWELGSKLGRRVAQDCQARVYDLRPDYEKSSKLHIASLKLSFVELSIDPVISPDLSPPPPRSRHPHSDIGRPNS